MINVNLLPPEIKEEINQTKVNKKTLSFVWRISFMAVLVIALIIALLYYFDLKQQDIAKENKGHQSEIDSFGRLEIDAKKLDSRLVAINKISANLNVWSGTIQEIQAIMPPGVYLTSFKYDANSKNRGQITGIASTQAAISSLRDSMEKSKKFTYVDIDKSQTQTDSVTKKENLTFTLSFALEKEALK